MATITRVIVTDDVTGEEGARTVRFGLDGVQYEIDLSQGNETALREALRTYVQHARKVGGKKASSAPKVKASAGLDLREVRAWAKAQGYDVRDRGQIRLDILDAFRAQQLGDASEGEEASPESETPIIGHMTEEGWEYARFEDAVKVAEREGRTAVRKGDGGVVVIEKGVPHTEALEKLVQEGKKAEGTSSAPARTNKRATSHVIRNLFKEDGLWTSKGENLDLSGLEVFTRDAKAWLGDHSELSSKTLGAADWREVYETFLAKVGKASSPGRNK